MRIPLILVAWLATTAAIAQAPRIKWRPMDFPITTNVKVYLDGKEHRLGNLKPFYDYVKTTGWSCAFDNAGGPRSGPSTLRCHGKTLPEPHEFYVEYLPEANALNFVEETGGLIVEIYEMKQLAR